MKAVKYQKKSLIKLEDLLRRRKTTLKKFLSERGITTYQMLEETCSRLGVVTPNFDSFNGCIPSYVSDPAGGVVVVPPLDVVSEATGAKKNADIFEAIPPTTAYEDNLENEIQDPLSVVNVLENESLLETKQIFRKKMKKLAGG